MAGILKLFGEVLPMKTKVQVNFSQAHKKYIKNLKKDRIIVVFLQIFILALFLGLWELFASVGVIDAFFFSSPSRMMTCLVELFSSSDIWVHMGISLLETILGFLIATALGGLIAILLWWSERARKVAQPYLIVLNSLPKIALGPIIIFWVGSGFSATVVMCVLICIVITTISLLSAFTSCDQDKVLLMQSMHASKFQILRKLILPNATADFISVLKINVGMSWVGTVMGEYLSSSAGLGYLINLGKSMLNLDLVMTSILLLCILAGGMYAIVNLFEKRYTK